MFPRAALIACALAAPAAAAEKTTILKTAAAAGVFKTLLTAVIAADLDDALKGDGPFTVFAPTDDAFAKLPKGTLEALLKPENKEKLAGILKYHVIAGKKQFNFGAADDGEKYPFKTLGGETVTLTKDGHGFKVNESRIVGQNVLCTNGSVQIIDRVLIPPTAAAAKGEKSIPEVAAEAGSFKTLLAALKAADLADLVGGPGPFTVFAPTDDAFAKLPKGTVESLLKFENKAKLAAILQLHVVPGRVTAKAFAALSIAKTAGPDTLTPEVRDGRLTVNGVSIVKTDIAASNGVIHVIDRVLLPGK